MFLVPFHLLMRDGLSTDADITAPTWRLRPTEVQWGTIAELFSDPAVPMLRSLVNSVLVSWTVQIALSTLRFIVQGVESTGINR